MLAADAWRVDNLQGIVQTLLETTAVTTYSKQRRETIVVDDMDLLARVRRLEPSALTEVHNLYYKRVYRYIYFRTGQTMVAEDLASEVFLRLLDALRDKNAPQNTIRGWLFGVASRVVADYYRKVGRAEEVMLGEQIAEGGLLPEDMVIKQISAESLHEAIQLLPENQQKVVALRFGAGMPIKEVANLLDKSEGAIKQLQVRAVAALAQQLTSQGMNG